MLARNKAKYVKLAELPRTAGDVPVLLSKGAASLELDMPDHSVKLIELVPAGR